MFDISVEQERETEIVTSMKKLYYIILYSITETPMIKTNLSSSYVPLKNIALHLSLTKNNSFTVASELLLFFPHKV